ncbi:MAG: aldehyde dehydrogenase family protein [Candidatus Marinimicrobia bacterium]|nr:aldehyde dehydrogenase family protein [Candidatus Neomarinimicrobiota bacterium]|tara:strand:- start:42454 stop:43974 length:1521 start_codon:yes stop_codon:yes gene_type:complete
MNNILEKLGVKEINYGACIGGDKWIESNDSGPIESINPTNHKLLAKVNKCNEEDYELVIQESLKAFEDWRMVPAPVRGQLILEMANELRNKKDLLGSLVALEMGKIKAEGDGEVQEMIDIADFAVGLSRQLYGLTMHSERPEHRMYEQWHPLGNVGIISAFNFPVAVWAWNAFIAAICGNVSIWKPSSKTPLCAIAVQNICNNVLEKNGYKGIFNLIIGRGSIIGEKFINDSRVPLISATGSTAMGIKVAKAVGARLGKTILELGGNNAIIVDETANMDLAIPGIVFGSVGTAGQRCTSTRRIIAHSLIFDDLVNSLIKAYKQVRIGDPLDSNTLMGPLIDQSAVEDYLAALKKVKAAGGEILYGGNVIDSSGSFVEPTIVRAENHYQIVQDETFAPILYVMKYDTLDEAIKLHNSVPQGLSSSIFTNSMINAETFLSHRGSDCGIANVNIGTSGAEIGGAFGGEKETGGGRESGSDAWKAYMRRQTNTLNWGSDLPLAQGIEFDI